MPYLVEATTTSLPLQVVQMISFEGSYFETPFRHLGLINLFFVIFVKLSIENPTKSPPIECKTKIGMYVPT